MIICATELKVNYGIDRKPKSIPQTIFLSDAE